MSSLPGYDQWLAGYGMSYAEVWCDNRTCANHQGTEVRYVSEYGQGWYEPEECPLCGGEWLDTAPADDEEDEDDA